MGNYESFNGSKSPKEYRGTQKSQRKEKGGRVNSGMTPLNTLPSWQSKWNNLSVPSCLLKYEKRKREREKEDCVRHPSITPSRYRIIRDGSSARPIS
jgi:hypothetical protein